MDASLLSTKFNIPPLNEKLVARPRLLEKMHTGLDDDRLLTLVCAPAGYGKTTLVSEWLNQIKNAAKETSTGDHPGKFAWLTLDESDNDLGRFLAYLIAALQQFQPGAGQGILGSLQTPRPPAPATLATWLINDLAELSGRFVLVLDDYHKISSQPIHDFLAFLIDHQPVRMSLVIVSRADPPLALARLRARGQLVELRQEDLSFTLEETQIYLKNIMGLEITADQLATLEARTEGWIAGLQLAALSMRNISDIPAFIEGFSGGHVHVADFLMDEVLAQQPDPVKDFLLQTSILERLSGPLCEAVSGYADAQEILEKLKEENLFLISLDYQQAWYRYHALFADLLRKRLYQTRGKQADELHQRASKWFAAQHLKIPAVEHALSGHDFQRAARLIEEIGESVLKRGETYTLLRWLEALPEEYQQEHPVMFVYYGLVLLMSGKPPDAAQSHLEKLASETIFEGLQGELETFQGLLAIMRGNAPETRRLSELALQHLAPEKAFFRGLAADSLGMAYTLIGDTAAAVKAFEQAVDISEQSGNLMLMLGALSNVAGLQSLQGKLRSAHTTYKRVIDISTERLGKHFSLTGKAFLGLGMLAREWNELDSALQYYEKAKEMLASSVEIGLPIVYLSIAYVKMNQGDVEGGQAQLDKAYQFAQASTLTSLDDVLVEETRARFWVAQGKLDQAQVWLQSQGAFEKLFIQALVSDDPRTLAGVMAKQTNYFTLARFHLAKKQPARALEILVPLLKIFEQKGQIRKVIEVLTLTALAHKQNGDVQTALEVLARALFMAEPEGYVRTFLDEGKPMAQLMYTAAAQGIYPVYIGRLLAAFSEEKVSISAPGSDRESSGSLIEPLSEREQEVLELIAKGLSNQEIAVRLHISLSTVKTHASQIYGKLNVHNRTQAVARARSLGLIPFV